METIFTLQKAETKDHKYSSPALSMTTAISGLLTFGSTICLMVILLTALSGGDVREELFAAAVAAALLSGSVFVISWLMFKKAKRVFLKKRKEMYRSARKLTGKVIGVTKHIRHVKYMRDTFDEILWSFKIEYKDGNEVKTVTSDKYLNDISKVLKSDRVSVFVLEDNTLVFKNYCLRNNESDPYIKLETEVTEQDAEI